MGACFSLIIIAKEKRNAHIVDDDTLKNILSYNKK